MNDNDERDGKNYGSSGINVLWPITANSDYKDALKKANDGTAFNNISPVFTYSLNNGVKVMWMGDMEHDFLEKVKDYVGEAPSDYLNYYDGYNTIKQNSAGDIVFLCDTGKVHVYVSKFDSSVDFLNDESYYNNDLGQYLGSFNTTEG